MQPVRLVNEYVRTPVRCTRAYASILSRSHGKLKRRFGNRIAGNLFAIYRLVNQRPKKLAVRVEHNPLNRQIVRFLLIFPRSSLLNIDELDIKVQVLSRQRMIAVDSNRFVFDRRDNKLYRLAVLALGL